MSPVADRRQHRLPVGGKPPDTGTATKMNIFRSEQVHYFAYASNLNKKQMQVRCPDSQPMFIATLPNYKIIFCGWSRQWRGGKATVKSFRGEKVRGAIYDVSEACLRQLDRYEAGYARLNVTVFDEDNEPHQAITYIKSGQLEESTPSKEYGEIIRQGYRDWGIA